MLIRGRDLERISDGTVSLAFRRWRQPSVRSGGTLLTAVGQLRIASVTLVTEGSIGERDAARAGYASLRDLLEELDQRPSGGDIYRIEFGGLVADPRIRLRESIPGATETDAIRRKLHELDRRSTTGPWTAAILQAIGQQPGVLAEALASGLGMEKLTFKARVRKLKALGLTISLRQGYELSLRGRSVVHALEPATGASGTTEPG